MTEGRSGHQANRILSMFQAESCGVVEPWFEVVRSRGALVQMVRRRGTPADFVEALHLATSTTMISALCGRRLFEVISIYI